MPFESADKSPAAYFPELDRLVGAPSSQHLSVRTENHDRDMTCMSHKGADDASGTQIPKLDRAVIVRRSEHLTVRTEDHGVDRTAMPFLDPKLRFSRRLCPGCDGLNQHDSN